MMNKEELINHYFENTLSIENQKEFDELIAVDSEFALEVAFQKNLKKAISFNEREKLKQKLQGFESQKSRKKTFKWPYIAASVAILMGSFWFLNKTPDSNELFNKYYQTYPNTIAPAVRGQNSNDLKATAFFEYDSDNFKKSHELFLMIYKKEQQDYALFYGSMSLIEMNRHREALTLLNQFNLEKNISFTPFVKWYKALCYLKLKQNQEAIILLNELLKTENPQQELASELVEKLE